MKVFTLFFLGLYDIHINMMGIPMLGWRAPEVLKQTCAKDHMNRFDLKSWLT
jgi:hypothetical protein